MIYEQMHPACGKIKGIGIPLKFSAHTFSPPGHRPRWEKTQNPFWKKSVISRKKSKRSAKQVLF